MTNLPTNPTKTSLMEQHWYEFLQALSLAGETTRNLNVVVIRHGYEFAFWSWYRLEKLKQEPTQ